MDIATAPERRLPSDRAFFTAMAVLVLLSTFLGFAPSFYLRFAMAPPHPLEPLTPLVFAHGLIFSLWILLFGVQTALVGTGNIALHRRLGLVGVLLVAIMIPLAIIVAIGGIHRPLTAAPGVSPLSWAALSLLDAPVFGGLIISALSQRRRPQVHKRLMLCAMVDMMRPSLGRFLPMLGLPGPVALIGPLLFLLPLIGWDLLTRGKVQPATIVGSVAVAAVTIATVLVWSTPPWLTFARMLSTLPL